MQASAENQVSIVSRIMQILIKENIVAYVPKHEFINFHQYDFLQ